MHIVYLDQNKWVELARAAKYPGENPALHSLLDRLDAAVSDGRLALPLTAANIYETYKVRDRQRRRDLASIQAGLSRGLVFRSRHKRLEEELSRLFREACGLPAKVLPENWFLSRIFFEAFSELDDPRIGFVLSDKLRVALQTFPDHLLFDYLVNESDPDRILGVTKFSDGSDELRQRIEDRRARHANETMAERRKIYSALLLIDDMDVVLGIAERAGTPWKTISDIGEKTVRRIPVDVAAYHVEREIVVRLESQARRIEENDFRDMQSFCAVVPYADEIITERHFASLAIQAKLDRKYAMRISRDVFRLREYL